MALAALGSFFVERILGVADPKPLPGDLLNYFYPTYRATAAQLARGVLPLWNPYQLCGVPWLAAVQPGVLYPPHLLHVALPLRQAMGLLGFAHLGLAGLAAWLVARRLGLAWFSALLVAGLWTTRGVLPFWVGFPSALEASAWLAPGCLGVLAASRAQLRPALLWLALATAMSVLAGHPQSAAYCVYLWLGLLLALLVAERASPRRWLTASAAALAGIGLGAAIAAAQLLPAFELARESGRGLAPLPVAQMTPLGSGGWARTESLLAQMDVPSGAVALLLVPCALLQRRRRRLALALLTLAGLTFGFALGPATPLFELYRHLPLLGSFRFPERVLLTTGFCLALLAGLGLDAVAWAAGRNARGLPADRAPVALLVGGLVLALAALELLAGPPRWRGWALYQDPDATHIFQDEIPLRGTLSDPNARVWIVSPGSRPRLASVLGLHGVDDYEPANLRRQAEYFGFLERGRADPAAGDVFLGRVFLLGRRAEPSALLWRQRLLDLTAARFVLVPSRIAASRAFARLVREAALRFEAQTPAWRLYENPTALPRAFVAQHTRPAPPRDELLALISRPDFDPRVLSYVEGEPGFTPASGATRAGAEARVERETLHRVEVAASLPEPGLVVLADSYYPGWRARVDDHEVPIRPVNLLFRGVPVTAGTHRIVFEYRPTSVALGAAISLTASLVWIGVAVSPRLRPAAR